MEVPSVPQTIDANDTQNLEYSKAAAASARERRKAKILSSSDTRIKYIVGTADTPVATEEEIATKPKPKPTPLRSGNNLLLIPNLR